MSLFKALVVLLQCNKLEVVKFFATYPGHHLEQSRFGDPECQKLRKLPMDFYEKF